MPRRSEIVTDAARFRERAARLPLVPRPDGPEVALAAAALVRAGVVVSAGDVPAVPAAAGAEATPVGEPSPYRLDQWPDAAQDWVSTNDRFSIDVHGAAAMTHIDTTEHFTWGDRSIPRPAEGALLRLAERGLVGRGVLIDVPGGVGRAVAPDEVVTLDDLQQVLAAAGTDVRPGDAVYLRFGRTVPARSDVPLGAEPMPGLSIECAEWIAERRPGVVVTDEGLDGFPSEVANLLVPWHVLLLTVLDIPLVDRATLTRLAEECARQQRWDFLSMIAPLPVPGASGSPVNPLLIL